MTDPATSASMSNEELIRLVEGWLRNAPDLSFKQVRKDARNLGLSVGPRQYSEAKKRIGITAGPPRTSPARSSVPRGDRMNGSQAPKTPLMTFLVEFLRNKPDGTYQEAQSAGVAAGFKIAPINYGNARRMLGMAAKSRASAAGGGRRRRAESAAIPADMADLTATAPAQRGRRGRKRKLDFSNLSNLVGELQDVVSERDRLLAAIDQIADIIRKI